MLCLHGDVTHDKPDEYVGAEEEVRIQEIVEHLDTSSGSHHSPAGIDVKTEHTVVIIFLANRCR